MAIIDIPDGEATELMRALELDAELGPPSKALNQAVYSSETLTRRVREAVRMRIALINDCIACRSARFVGKAGVTDELYDHVEEWASYPGYSDAERVAIEYAERFALEHRSIDGVFFARLKEHFDHKEILALALSVNYFLAFGRFVKVLQLHGACALDGTPTW